MLTTDISRKKHTSINGKYTLDTPKVINAFFSISIILGVILHFSDIIATNNWLAFFWIRGGILIYY